MTERTSPFPLDGGRAGDGGGSAAPATEGSRGAARDQPSASSPHPQPRPFPHPPTGRGPLTTGSFDPGSLLSAFCADRADVGGVVSFTGLCRADGGVLALELEAYPGFTEREIAREADGVLADHSLLDLLVLHRTGRIAPGEAIVFVAAAAAHRRAAFLAADRMMDYLKSRAPFWKKEHTAGGSRWIEPRPQDHADAARWRSLHTETAP